MLEAVAVMLGHGPGMSWIDIKKHILNWQVFIEQFTAFDVDSMPQERVLQLK